MAFQVQLRVALLLLTLAGTSLEQVFGQSVISQTAKGPCAKIGPKFAAGTAVSPSEYRACLKTFAFRPKQSRSLLNTIWKVIVTIYPYINIARNAPSKELFLQARIRRDLFRIRAKFATYKYDFDFQKDLHFTIKALNDGHTSWSPSCYTAGSAQNGFPLVHIYDATTNTTKIKVAGLADFQVLLNAGVDVFKLTEQRLGISLIDYAGAEVLRIGRLPAVDYAENLARRAGAYKDQQTRLNDLFLRPAVGDSYILGGLMTPSFLPEQDTVPYTVRRVGSEVEETFDVPFFVFYDGEEFSTNGEYYAVNCRASYNLTLTAASARKAGIAHRVRYNMPRKLQKVQFKTTPEFAKVENYGFRSASTEVDFFKVYVDTRSQMAVLVIPDFSGGGVPYIFAQMLTAYEQLRTSGATRLLIDVSNNGGGFGITASYLVNLLFPGTGDPQFWSQFKAPPFARAAVRAATAQTTRYPEYPSDYDWSTYENTRTDETFQSASEFFFPLQNLTQAGITDSFSSLFQQSYTYEDFDVALDSSGNYTQGVLPTKRLFAPKDILILSNGLCYSTCAIFTTQLNQLLGVKIVTIGGRQTEGPFSYSDGLVGFVKLDYMEDFYKPNVLALGLQKLPSAPKPLPVKGTLAFVLAQSYNAKNSKIPAEFVYTPGQFHIKQTDENVLSIASLWNESTLYFDA